LIFGGLVNGGGGEEQSRKKYPGNVVGKIGAKLLP
jgi:hypothetical protein